MESKSFEFPKENYENKLAALNEELKRLFLSLKESSESFTNSLLEEKWSLISFPYNSEVPKALSKDEIYLLVERHDGFIKTYVPYGGSGGIPDYICVFHSDFDEFNFYRFIIHRYVRIRNKGDVMNEETKSLLEKILQHNEKIRLTEKVTLFLMFSFFLLGSFLLVLSMFIISDVFVFNPDPIKNSRLTMFFFIGTIVLGFCSSFLSVHQLNFHYKNLKQNNFSIKKTKEFFIKERDEIIEKITDKNLMILLDETKKMSVNSYFYNETNRRIALKIGIDGVADQKRDFLIFEKQRKNTRNNRKWLKKGLWSPK